MQRQKIQSRIELVTISEQVKELLNELDSTWKYHSIMLPNERLFLGEMVYRTKPRNILELGVAGGGGSVILLQASKDYGSQVASIDTSTTTYYAQQYPVGYAVQQYSQFEDRWSGYFGNMSCYYMDQIIEQQFGGEPADLVVLDTQHSYPGEILDFIQVFPYLSPNAVVICHDASLDPLNIDTFALMHGTKYFPAMPDKPDNWRPMDTFTVESGEDVIRTAIPNIGAVELDDIQRDHMYDFFHVLQHKWAIRLRDEQILKCTELICENYEPFFVQMWGKILERQGYK